MAMAILQLSRFPKNACVLIGFEELVKRPIHELLPTISQKSPDVVMRLAGWELSYLTDL